MRKRLKAFTLTELLVVMAILGFLMTLSVAGIQFALKRSRDIQRKSIVTTLESAVISAYSTSQAYPLASVIGSCIAETSVGTGVKLCANSSGITTGPISTLVNTGTTPGSVGDFIDGAWTWGPIETNVKSFGYYVDTNGLDFGVCVLTEDAGKVSSNASNQKLKGCFCKGTLAPVIQAQKCVGLSE